MLFPKKLLKTKGHQALLISSAASHYPYCTFFTDCISSFVLSPYVTTLTIALDSFLAQTLRLLQGQGKAVELLMISRQTTKNHCKATRWFCLHILLEMHNSSSLRCGLCCWGAAGIAPQRLRNPTEISDALFLILADRTVRAGTPTVQCRIAKYRFCQCLV